MNAIEIIKSSICSYILFYFQTYHSQYFYIEKHRNNPIALKDLIPSHGG